METASCRFGTDIASHRSFGERIEIRHDVAPDKGLFAARITLEQQNHEHKRLKDYRVI